MIIIIDTNFSKKRLDASYFEYDFTYNRLNEFIKFIGELKRVEDMVDNFSNYKNSLNSVRLKELITSYDISEKELEKKSKKPVNPYYRTTKSV